MGEVSVGNNTEGVEPVEVVVQAARSVQVVNIVGTLNNTINRTVA